MRFRLLALALGLCIASPTIATPAPEPHTQRATSSKAHPKSKKPKTAQRRAGALHTPAHTPGFGDPAHGGSTGRYAVRDDSVAWAREFAAASGWTETEVLAVLAQARYQKRAAQLMMPPPQGVPKDWGAYRDRFVEPDRLQAGLRFWEQHADTLARAEAQTGVPAELIMGILGVETYYGRVMGSFRVLDALSTLAFDFPGGRSDRSPYFREQLGELLRLARTEGREPSEFQGSFAGAMGLGQFMPGSWRSFAVDFDGDGHIDLMRNPADAIGSVAHFLLQHGWTPGMPTHRLVPAPTDVEARDRLLAPDLEGRWSLADLKAAGLDVEGLPDLPWALQALDNGGAAPTHALVSRNFWVVTRYNRSSYYALAVITLGERLAALRHAR